MHGNPERTEKLVKGFAVMPESVVRGVLPEAVAQQSSTDLVGKARCRRPRRPRAMTSTGSTRSSGHRRQNDHLPDQELRGPAIVAPRRIVAYSTCSALSKVAQAATNTAPSFGVSGPMGAALGEMCDVTLGGLAQLEPGRHRDGRRADHVRRQRAWIAAVAAAASTRRVVCFATEPGVNGDVIWVNVNPSLLDRG